MIRQYKERRIYFSGKCSACGKPFQSFHRSKIKNGKFRKCRTHEPDPNQVALFATPDLPVFTKVIDPIQEGVISMGATK